MATVALTIVGAAIGGPVGAAIGATIGGYVDSKYLYPALFPTPAIKVGKLRELNLQNFSEGGPINICIGPECRTTGTVIWIGPPIQKKADRGGKGVSGGDKVIKYKYYANVAVAMAKGPISKIKKIWADSKLLYDDQPDFSFTSNQISAKVIIRTKTERRRSNNIFDRTFSKYIEFTAPETIIDFTKFRGGAKPLLRVSGFVTAGNNTNFWVIFSTRKNADFTTTASCIHFILSATSEDNIGPAKTEAAGALVTVSQDNEKFDPRQVKAFTFYTGTETQNADPLIDAYEGSVPGFRGTAYVVLEELALQEYGNRIPQFEFLIEADASPYLLSTAIGKILQLYGFTATDYDVSAVTGNLRGYILPGPTVGRIALEPLLIANNLIVQESNGKLVFKLRNTQSLLTVTSSDLAAHIFGQDTSRPVEFDEIEEFNLPAEININYIDPALDWQKATQGERRIKFAVDSVQSFDLGMTLNATEARSIAGRILWNSWRNQQLITFKLPPHYIQIEEGDLVTVTAFGQNFSIMIQKVSRGNDNIAEFTGVVEDISDFSAPGASTVQTVPKITRPSTVQLEIVDIAPLRDIDLDTAGYYFLAANYNPNEKWQGAVLYKGINSDAVEFENTIVEEAILGDTVVQINQTEIIVDNEDSGVMLTGPWLLSTSGTAPHGGSSRITVTNGATIKWDVTYSSVGIYRVFTRFTGGSGRTKKAKYEVNHDTGTITTTLDQSNEFLWDKWIFLGEHVVTVAGVKNVILTAQDDGSTCGDAIRIFKIDSSNRLLAGPVGYWDRINTVSVRINSGTLESKTEDEVMQGQNIAVIGSEIIGFRTATLTATLTYTLSNLLRGLRDTEPFVSTHVAGERFVLLDQNVLNFQPIDISEVGVTKYFKVAAPGQIVADVAAQQQTLVGSTLRPFSPARITADNDMKAGFNTGIKVAYFFRTRAISRVLNTSVWQPVGADFGSFHIQIRNQNKVLKREFNILASSFIYTNEEQNIDGILTGQTIEFTVYQQSVRYGIGNGAVITKIATV